MRLAAFAAVLAAALLAGCQASPALERLRGVDPVPEPLYLEHRVLAAPGHERAFALEVGPRASEINVTLRLEPRGGTPLTATPARLDVELLAPSGARVANATVDPLHPERSLVVLDIAERGTWGVRVSGAGASQTVQGQPVGAAYLLTLEVLHE